MLSFILVISFKKMTIPLRPHSPELAPYDPFFIPSLKYHIAGHRYNNSTWLRSGMINLFKGIHREGYVEAFKLGINVRDFVLL
jgi:hypothetical protein